MTTYTWLGATAPWTSTSFWTVNDIATGGVPGAADTAIIAASGAITISIGTVAAGIVTITDPDATLSVATSLIVGSQVSSGGVSNAGTILVAAGGSLAIGGNASGFFSNTGVIQLASGARLVISAPMTTASLGAVQNSGGTVELLQVNNVNATLSSAAYGNLSLGSVTGGTIRNDGGTLTILGGGIFQGETLDGVTFQGILEPQGIVAIADGLIVQSLSGGSPGIIAMGTSDNSSLSFVNSQVLDNVLIGVSELEELTSPGQQPYRFSINGNTTLTLGSGSVMHATANPTPIPWFENITNYGVLLQGTALIADGSIDNTGRLKISTNAFSNNGTLDNLGGSILISGSTVSNAGIITAAGGSVSIQHAITGTGLLGIAFGGTMSLGGSYDHETFGFVGDGKLVLSFVGGTNGVVGFNPGDTIELLSTPASVTFTNATLAINSGAQTLANFIMPGVPANAQFHATTDGNSNTFITETIPCFAAGTRIRTVGGEVAVEDLRPGMSVVSAFGGSVQVQWIGRRDIECHRHLHRQNVWPVRVRTDAFGPGLPARDLWLSPDHAIYIDGVLIPVSLLQNGITIVQQQTAQITYFHVELPAHDVILAEGLPAESYLDTGNRASFENGGPHRWQPPHVGWHVWDEQACAELVLAGPRLDAVRARLGVAGARAA